MRKQISILCLALAAAAPLLSDPAASPPTAPAAKEHVLGIGGFFFRSKDPDSLAKWYWDNLGINLVPQSYGGVTWKQEAGETAFAPFPADTDYFGDKAKDWMLNFRVGNLDAMVAQLRAAGITVKGGKKMYPNGRFAHLKDPEGNPIELWEPKADSKTANKALQ